MLTIVLKKPLPADSRWHMCVKHAGDGDDWNSFEDTVATISRATGTLTFLADSMLVAAMNPSPCGYYGDLVRAGTCFPSVSACYHTLSAPVVLTATKSTPSDCPSLLDRARLHHRQGRPYFNLSNGAQEASAGRLR